MEITCNRCHQTVQADSCYCPVCGLPQLTYTADAVPGLGQGQTDRWTEPVRDAGSIDWKAALRVALLLAVPAGMLCSFLSPVGGIFGFLLMAMTAAWVVVLYVRGQRAPWITIGAGARIGLVTGVLGAWVAAATTAVTLFSMRFWFHQGKFFDDLWQTVVNQQTTHPWNPMGVDAQTIAAQKAWLLSPEGRVGWLLAAISFLMAALLLFAVAGGALGARMLGRTRRPEI